MHECLHKNFSGEVGWEVGTDGKEHERTNNPTTRNMKYILPLYVAEASQEPGFFLTPGLTFRKTPLTWQHPCVRAAVRSASHVAQYTIPMRREKIKKDSTSSASRQTRKQRIPGLLLAILPFNIYRGGWVSLPRWLSSVLTIVTERSPQNATHLQFYRPIHTVEAEYHGNSLKLYTFRTGRNGNGGALTVALKKRKRREKDPPPKNKQIRKQDGMGAPHTPLTVVRVLHNSDCGDGARFRLSSFLGFDFLVTPQTYILDVFSTCQYIHASMQTAYECRMQENSRANIPRYTQIHLATWTC